MNKNLSEKPRLPPELYRASRFGASAFISYSVALFIVPAALSRFIVGTDLPMAIQLIAALPLLLLAQQGLHLLGWVGHEGLHLSLARNRYVSASLGIFFSSMIINFMEIGWAASHWNHHRYTNQASDPDCQLYSRYQSFWSRLLFARLASNRVNLANTLRMLLGKPLGYAYSLPFPPHAIRALAGFNIACSLLWLSVYAAIAFFDSVTGLVSIAIPHVLGLLYTGLRPYVEHAGTGSGLFLDARTRTSPFFSILYFFNNYHLEHHLYPWVPCYRLPAVHRFLKEYGYFRDQKVHIEPGVLAAYAHTTARSRYPCGTPTDEPPAELLSA
jgi:beta-carotene hydroxylase